MKVDSETLFTFIEGQRLSIILFFFICGTCFGSFLNCVAFRIVRKEDWIRERSRCPACHHALGLFDLIPILSWLFLKGKCRYCGNKISVQYLLSELFMGTVFILTYLETAADWLSMIFHLALFSLFFCLSLIDLESYIIPNGFIILGILNRFILTVIHGKLLADLNDLSDAFLIALVVYVAAIMTNTVSGKECVGAGDIKLIFVVCLYTGLYKSILVLFLSSLLGLLVVLMTGKRKIPFGPCVCLAAAAVILYGDLLMKFMFL